MVPNAQRLVLRNLRRVPGFAPDWPVSAANLQQFFPESEWDIAEGFRS